MLWIVSDIQKLIGTMLELQKEYMSLYHNFDDDDDDPDPDQEVRLSVSKIWMIFLWKFNSNSFSSGMNYIIIIVIILGNTQEAIRWNIDSYKVAYFDFYNCPRSSIKQQITSQILWSNINT